MSSEWKRMKIGDLCDQFGAELQTGPFGSQLHSYDYKETGVPVVPTEAIDNGKINPDVLPKISKEKASELSRHTLRQGDILFARRGAQATGKTAITRRCDEGAICGTGAIRLRIEPAKSIVLPTFLAAYLSSKETITWIRHHAIGATMPNLNEGIIRSIPILLPSLQEQKAIAHILGTLDDKIELNRKTNETLEAMAKALFKSWFVDFDPVRAKAEGRPTGLPTEISDLFPDSFEDSELGKIPSGWKIASLGEEFNWKEGKPWNKEDRVEQSAISVFGANGSIGFGAKQMGDTRVIFVGKIGSCGAINYHNGSFWATNNTHFLALDENPFLEYARQALGVIDFSQYIGGSSNPYMPFGNFAHHQILSPPLDILRIFCDCVTPLRESIERSEEKSTTLCSLRDALLPKLISGEIRIPDAEKMLEEVDI